jgi:hypothetical protein
VDTLLADRAACTAQSAFIKLAIVLVLSTNPYPNYKTILNQFFVLTRKSTYSTKLLICRGEPSRFQGAPFEIVAKNRRNDPSANTAPLSVAYREIVTYHDREFQLYSINNSIHFAPVDEVRAACDPEATQARADLQSRSKSKDSTFNIVSSSTSLMTVSSSHQ